MKKTKGRGRRKGERYNAEGIYSPPPEVVLQRASDVRWLQRCGFGEKFIKAVMDRDEFDMEEVKQKVSREGLPEARTALEMVADALEVIKCVDVEVTVPEAKAVLEAVADREKRK